MITGKKEADEIIKSLLEYFPEARIVLTLGGDSAVYADKDTKITQPVFKVNAVDTTAAGDTFTGDFLAGIIEGMPVADILRMSAKASSIAVTRKGAIPSIPYRSEVEY
jgi:ribokinase